MEKRKYIYPITEVMELNAAELMKTAGVSDPKPLNPAPVKREVF
jgi:hypothetical protein